MTDPAPTDPTPAVPAVEPTPAEPAGGIIPTEPTPPADPAGVLKTAEPAPEPFDIAKLSLPEGFSLSDDDKTFIAKFATDFKVNGPGMSGLMDRYTSAVKAASDGAELQAKQAWTTTIGEWKTSVEKTYGDKLEDVVTRAEKVIDEFGGQPFRDFLKISGGHSNPAMIAFMDKVSSALGESKPVTPGGEPNVDADPFSKMYPSMKKA